VLVYILHITKHPHVTKPTHMRARANARTHYKTHTHTYTHISASGWFYWKEIFSIFTLWPKYPAKNIN